MNELINPVVEIRRMDAELKKMQEVFSAFLDRAEQEDEFVKRIRFDLDEFKAGVKENKSDKAVSSAVKRLEATINSMQEVDKELMKEIEAINEFLNEERFKPIFDRLKELEKEFKQKAIEVVQGSLASG
jgi:HD-GYP domain-containing protein (c-di-GMP phosphodiesterase class II)